MIKVYLCMDHLISVAIPISINSVDGLIIMGSQLIIPKFIQYFIDKVPLHQDPQIFIWLLLTIVGLVFLHITLSAIRNIPQRSLQEKASRDMQYFIYTHLRK